MCTKKAIEGFLILVEKIPLLANNIYRACSSHILDTLFAYKVRFFAHKNHNVGTTATGRRFQFYA